MALRAFFLILCMSFFASFVHADLRMVPGVDLRLEYNDNVFLEPEEEEDDLIATVAPNFSLNWDAPRLDVSLYASVAMEKYLDNTEEDRIGADANQSSRLDALARIYRENLFLRISDSYERVPIDEAGRGGEGNRNINLTDTNRFQFNPYLQFEPMKETRVKLGYTYENIWYEEDEADDSINHLHYATVTKGISPKISMFLSGTYNQYRPKDAEDVLVFGEGGSYDYDQQTASVGFSYQATHRLHLNGQYGHSWLDYGVRSDSDAETWSAGADYEISSNYTTGVQYSKDYTMSVEDGPSETDHILAYLGYEERFGLNFQLFARSRDFVEIDRSTDSYGAELSGDLPFNEKVGVTGLLRYTNFDDSGIEPEPIVIIIDNSFVVVPSNQPGVEAEEYHRYSARYSLYYATRLGRMSAGYIYNRNDSDLDNADYTNNIVFLEASLKF